MSQQPPPAYSQESTPYSPPSGYSAYPPQSNYPPQTDYPPQTGYPPQAGYPPLSSYPQQPGSAQQQTTSSFVVVQEQPNGTFVTMYTTRPHYYTVDNAFVFSIAAAVGICITFGWCGLWCVIPGIAMAVKAQAAQRRGDTRTAESQKKASFALSMTGVAVGGVSMSFTFIIIIISVILADDV